MKKPFAILGAFALVTIALMSGCSGTDGTTPNCPGWSDAATNDVCTSLHEPVSSDDAGTEDTASDDSSTQDAAVD